MKKAFVFGIILLFFFMSTNTSFAVDNVKKSSTPIINGNTLYVGGNGTGNYSRIQDAINDAVDGDTVFVFNDSSPYYENVVIDESINLIGENRETTVIDGNYSGHVVNIITNGVTISGFTIQKCGDDVWEYAGIYMYYTEGNTITGNIITNNGCHGIYCYNEEYPLSGFNVISNNIVTKNRFGIVLDISFYNEVYDNYVEDNNEFGIFVGSSLIPSENIKHSLDDYYNNIYRNTIINSYIGIDIDPASFTNVFKNNIMNNNYGIYISAPYLTTSSYNNIYQNNIHNNTHGIEASAWGGIIANNNISENNILYNEEGISLLSYRFILWGDISYNTISINNFIGNNNSAYFEYLFFSSRDCNQWVGNYWGKARFLPYLILGKLKILKFTILWIAFDWHPAKKPYDIPT